MISAKHITVYWLGLITLTLLSASLGLFGIHPTWLILVVLIIIFFKGLLISDYFMELKYAPKIWRNALLSFVLIIPTVIALIYIL